MLIAGIAFIGHFLVEHATEFRRNCGKSQALAGNQCTLQKFEGNSLNYSENSKKEIL
jgi:hypothetical protein